MIWTEWDKLTEIVVGSVYSPEDFHSYCDLIGEKDNEFADGVSKILEETLEDLEELSSVLRSAGIKVHRPKNLKLKPEQTRMHKADFPYPGICPRDMHVAYGNTILSTIGGDPCRYNEADFYSQIMLSKHREGRDYISMPRPLLDSEYRNYQELEGQILWHAANLLKCGDAILHTMPYGDGRQGRGTYAGLEWIKKNIGYDCKWYEIPRSGHADGRLALIKPGLIMAKDRNMIPKELQHWDMVQIDLKPIPKAFNEMQDHGFYKSHVMGWLKDWIGYAAETLFDVNGLSIDDKTFITNGYDKVMTDKFKKHNVEVVPFNFRHRYFFDAGLHCVTLDLSREGSRGSYV